MTTRNVACTGIVPEWKLHEHQAQRARKMSKPDSRCKDSFFYYKFSIEISRNSDECWWMSNDILEFCERCVTSENVDATSSTKYASAKTACQEAKKWILNVAANFYRTLESMGSLCVCKRVEWHVGIYHRQWTPQNSWYYQFAHYVMMMCREKLWFVHASNRGSIHNR